MLKIRYPFYIWIIVNKLTEYKNSDNNRYK